MRGRVVITKGRNKKSIKYEKAFEESSHINRL